MNKRNIKKTLVLAVIGGLLGGPIVSWTPAEARPPRGNPTSPVHIRAWKGFLNRVGARVPSHQRPPAPQSAAHAAVGNPPPANRPPARRMDSRGRVARHSRPSLHREGSRSGSRRTLSRRGTGNLRRGDSQGRVHHYGAVPQNATQPSTYDRVPSFDVQAGLRRAALARPVPTPPGSPPATTSTTTTTTTTRSDPSTVPWGGVGTRRPPWGGVGPNGQPQPGNPSPSPGPPGSATVDPLARPLPRPPGTDGRPLPTPPTGRNNR
jgi:hypothetical protein